MKFSFSIYKLVNILFLNRHSFWSPLFFNWSINLWTFQIAAMTRILLGSFCIQQFEIHYVETHLTTGFLFLVTFFLFLLLPFDHVEYTKFSPSMGSKQNKWVSMQHYTIQRNQHRWFHRASLSSSLVNPLGTAWVQENNS